MRVVLDTNVFVSSFFGGNPRKIIDMWKSGEVTLGLSSAIIEEYVEVLRRLGMKDDKELVELLGLLARGYHIVFASKTPILHIVRGDPDDDKFIECAVAVKAEMIISGDKRVLALRNYMNIRIVTPREFVESI